MSCSQKMRILLQNLATNSQLIETNLYFMHVFNLSNLYAQNSNGFCVSHLQCKSFSSTSMVVFNQKQKEKPHSTYVMHYEYECKLLFETNSSVMNKALFATYEHVAPCFQPIESIIRHITCM